MATVSEAGIVEARCSELHPSLTATYSARNLAPSPEVLLSTLDGDVRFGAWLLYVGPDGLRKDPGFAPRFEDHPGGRAGPHDLLLR